MEQNLNWKKKQQKRLHYFDEIFCPYIEAKSDEQQIKMGKQKMAATRGTPNIRVRVI